MISRTVLPESVTKKLPRHADFPATLLGRFARGLQLKLQQIGDRLMASALYRAVAASKEVASWAIVTDPKDDRARILPAAYCKPRSAISRKIPLHPLRAVAYSAPIFCPEETPPRRPDAMT